jgi:hypothetical protein
MSTTEAQAASPDPRVGKVDMKLEVHVIPVSDVDRSERVREEDWPAWYASYMAAEQAGTDLPT